MFLRFGFLTFDVSTFSTFRWFSFSAFDVSGFCVPPLQFFSLSTFPVFDVSFSMFQFSTLRLFDVSVFRRFPDPPAVPLFLWRFPAVPLLLRCSSRRARVLLSRAQKVCPRLFFTLRQRWAAAFAY
jgi:hypothetical protein